MQRRKWTRTAICLAATTATFILTILYFVSGPLFDVRRPGKRKRRPLPPPHSP